MWKNKKNKVTINMISIISALLIIKFCPHSWAQSENLSAPLPGGAPDIVNMNNAVPKAQETHQIIQSTVTSENEKENSIFLVGMTSDKYPISINGLRALVEKYKEEAAQANSDARILDSMLNWLDALLRAHNRLAIAFAKQSDLKSAFENECSLIRQLRAIKNEILYVKAQELIKGKKLKQAIPILVDITCSEPNSTLGLKAYQHLKQSGFSSERNLALSKPEDDLKINKEQ